MSIFAQSSCLIIALLLHCLAALQFLLVHLNLSSFPLALVVSSGQCFFLVFLQVWYVFFFLKEQRMSGISFPVCLILLERIFAFFIHFTSNDKVVCFFLNVYYLILWLQHFLCMHNFCSSCQLILWTQLLKQ